MRTHVVSEQAYTVSLIVDAIKYCLYRRRVSGLEPQGDTGACLNKGTEPGSYHGPEATWQLESPPNPLSL
jgi:hypothetical protein